MVDECLSGLIGLIYEAALRPSLWIQVLEQVAAVTPCAVATFYSHDRVAHVPTFYETYGGNPAYVQDYIDRWAASNPIIDAMAKLEPGDVAGLATILDLEAFMRHPYYLEWGRPQGYCDVINLMLERTPTRVSSVSLIRDDGHGLADPASLERIRLLAPHFLRAIRIGRVLENATVKADTITTTLDSLASAVVLLHQSGALMHANARARDLMSDGLTLGQINSAVQGADDPERPQKSAGKGAALDRAFLVELPGGKRFVGHAMPLELGAGRLNGVKLTLVALQSTVSTDTAVRNAASIFGLTARERDVLFGLVEVGGAPSIAAMLGLSRGTVQTHMKSLFAKTQMHRQADLVRLVSDLMTPFY